MTFIDQACQEATASTVLEDNYDRCFPHPLCNYRDIDIRINEEPVEPNHVAIRNDHEKRRPEEQRGVDLNTNENERSTQALMSQMLSCIEKLSQQVASLTARIERDWRLENQHHHQRRTRACTCEIRRERTIPSTIKRSRMCTGDDQTCIFKTRVRPSTTRLVDSTHRPPGIPPRPLSKLSWRSAALPGEVTFWKGGGMSVGTDLMFLLACQAPTALARTWDRS